MSESHATKNPFVVTLVRVFGLVRQAAIYKATKKLSYADAFTATLAELRNTVLVTGDLEFKAIEDVHNSGWFAIFHNENLGGIVTDRSTGKLLTLKDLPTKSTVDPAYTLIYEEFMKAYVKHLKEKGWLQTA